MQHLRMAESSTRVLSLDLRLENPRVENASYGGSRTLLEHQIVIWNPREIVYGYSQGSVYMNAPTLNDHGTAEFLGDLKRRQQEIVDFLGLGRMLVVLLPSPFKWYVGTGQEVNKGTRANPRITRYVEPMSVQDVLPVEVELVEASGARFRLLSGPPFSTFWKATKELFHYNAYLRNAVGSPLLAIAGTDRVVAATAEVHGGTVLLLPQMYTFSPDIEQEEGESEEAFDERWSKAQNEVDRDVATTLVDGLIELSTAYGSSSDDALPPWAERYALPREIQARKALATAEQRASEAAQKVEKERAGLVELQRRKILVTGTGRSLEQAVERALADLGADVEPGAPHRTDRVVRWKSHVGVMEIKGLAKSAAESDAAQLEKWVSEYRFEHDETPKGILVVNAWRELPLNERDEPAFPPQMRPYCEKRDHCLIETRQLLSAVELAKTAKDRDAFLRLMFEHVGVLGGFEWTDALTEISDEER